MTDEADVELERRVAEGLSRLGEVDPRRLDRFYESFATLPERGVRRLPWRSESRLLAGMAAAAGALVLIVGGWWLAGPTPFGPSATGRPAAEASPRPSPTPASSADLSPTRFASDPRMLACERAGGRELPDVLYAWELTRGSDYRANLRLPVQPELASAPQPALVVVFKTGDSSTTSGGNPPAVFTPPPGSHSVCIGLTGVTRTVYIRNLAENQLVLPPASAPVGPIAGVAAATSRPLAAMTWDRSRDALWVVTWATGPNGQLTRVDAGGSTMSWALPNGPDVQIQPKIQAGLAQPGMPAAWYGWEATDVVVDGRGEVWVAAGYGLVRFDPATGRSQLRVFPESDMTKVYLDGGHWLSAIAPDGDGVLVARHGDHRLTRVDESLTDVGAIALPVDWTDIRGIAVLGDRILAGGPAGLGAFDRSGAQLAATATGVPFASLEAIGSDRAAILPTSIGQTEAIVVDARAASAGTIALPMEAIQGNLAYDRLVAATDWTDRVWYGEWDDEQPVYVVHAAVPGPH